LAAFITLRLKMKKTALYIIDSLERGGAEVMLVSTLKEIKSHYHIILVTLRPQNAFDNSELVYDKKYCLNLTSKKNIFSCARKLKEIIKTTNASIVHSTLFWSVIVARLACKKKVPHIFSLATIMSTGVYRDRWYSGYTKFLDRLTYRKNQCVISPTNEVLKDFDRAIGIKGKSKVLPNFVNTEFFENQIIYPGPITHFKLVAVGNLKEVKNYQLLIEAFKSLKDLNISIDIYGEGPDRILLERQIKEFDLPIKLMGLNDKVYNVLPSYNGFVMCSFIEGFGISAAEAMATGLPLLLSDIASLHEVSQNNALFFDPYSPKSFITLAGNILNGKTDMKALSEKGKKIAKENYTKDRHIKNLLQLYDEMLQEKQLLKAE
jgi:glycosyltransferase involved in cell wall biosynthesis